MNDLINVGKKRTIAVYAIVLIVTIFSMFFYSYKYGELDSARLTKQLIRLVLTVFLLLMMYKGKQWARVIVIILFSLLILGILIALSSSLLPVPSIDKVIYTIMILVYAVAIYYIGFSKSFKAFFRYQKTGDSAKN